MIRKTFLLLLHVRFYFLIRVCEHKCIHKCEKRHIADFLYVTLTGEARKVLSLFLSVLVCQVGRVCLMLNMCQSPGGERHNAIILVKHYPCCCTLVHWQLQGLVLIYGAELQINAPFCRKRLQSLIAESQTKRVEIRTVVCCFTVQCAAEMMPT